MRLHHHAPLLSPGDRRNSRGCCAGAYRRCEERSRPLVASGRDPLFAAFEGSNCPSLPQSVLDAVRVSVLTELIRLGVAPSTIVMRWRTGAMPTSAEGADGLVEPSRRRVDIEVRPDD